MTLRLEGAVAYAAQAHAGQRYGDGPYILHPLRVMMAVSSAAQVPAVLHDCLEDAGVLPPDLDPVHEEAIRLLTRDEKKQTYEEYVERLVNAGGPEASLAREVKLADLQDNMSHMRPDKFRLMDRYLVAAERIRSLVVVGQEPDPCPFCGEDYYVGECCVDCWKKCKCVWVWPQNAQGANVECPVHGLPPYRMPHYKMGVQH